MRENVEQPIRISMSDAHLAPSSTLGHFNLLEEIGRGGMGLVFRAFDPTLNREVAIKILREDLASNPQCVAEFLGEARIVAGISHPHIVQIYSIGEDRGQSYIVMELLKGRTLREVIEKEGPLGEERALDLAIDVGEALRAANLGEMVHGDIKPGNIFVTELHGAKVLDFGLAKLANVEVRDHEGFVGSPYYVSPERVGQRAEDFHTDVYSLGATLFHALSGRPPFDAVKVEDLVLKRLNVKPPLLREARIDVTPKTEQVVGKMLNKSVLMRYRDYDMLLEDLRAAKTEATAKRLGISLQPQIRFQRARTAALRWRRRLMISLAVLVLAGAAASAWMRSEPKPRAVADHHP